MFSLAIHNLVIIQIALAHPHVHTLEQISMLLHHIPLLPSAIPHTERDRTLPGSKDVKLIMQI